MEVQFTAVTETVSNFPPLCFPQTDPPLPPPPAKTGYYYIGNFALECAGPRTSKMRYLAPTYLDALLGVKAGFLPDDFRLPKLKKESDEGAVTGPGFPASSESVSGGGAVGGRGRERSLQKPSPTPPFPLPPPLSPPATSPSCACGRGGSVTCAS